MSEIVGMGLLIGAVIGAAIAGAVILVSWTFSVVAWAVERVIDLRPKNPYSR